MGIPRRKILQMAGGFVALPALVRAVSAEAYPSRPVRLLVGFPPGGTTDVSARILAQHLSDRFGQPFIIENKAGAATNLATEAVVRARPDGHTLLIATTTNAINETLYNKLSYQFGRDITLVAGLTRTPLVFEVNPALPTNSVPEFIAHAKSNPDKVTIASFGTGTISHVAGELFKMATGVNTIHVPYKGSGPMITDLLSGQVNAAFDNLPASIEHIRAGELRPLAVTTAQPSAALPQTPTLAQFLPGYEASAWTAVAAPKGTPTEIVEALNTAINAALDDPRIKARFANLGAAVFVAAHKDLSGFVAEQTEKWANVIRTGNVKAE